MPVTRPLTLNPDLTLAQVTLSLDWTPVISLMAGLKVRFSSN